jgi:type II secretory pathway predicted ATPase ExeA
MNLAVNEDIKSRVTYSKILKPLGPDLIKDFIFAELDKAKLGHNVFTEDAADLIVRTSTGILRKARNLALSCLLEAVREQTKTVDLKIVNKVIIQPHWRREEDILYA